MRKRIGEFLVEKGVLTPGQVEQVLAHSRTTGQRFGDAAVSLKFLNERKLIQIFGANNRFDFFHVHPSHVPIQTLNVFPVSVLLRAGVLPLGAKTTYRFFRRRKTLNLGMLNPSQNENIDALKVEAQRAGFDSIRIYLILANHFLGALANHYGMTADRIHALDPATVDPTLWMFLEVGAKGDHAQP